MACVPYCDHPKKCFNYAEELAASVDRRINPCDNMYEHVCGKWDRLTRTQCQGRGPVPCCLTADLKTDKRYGLSLEIEAATDMEASMAATRYVKHCITHVAPSVTSDLASAFAERIQKPQTTWSRPLAPSFPVQGRTKTTLPWRSWSTTSPGTVRYEWLKVINGHMLPGRTVDMTEPVLTINGSGLLLKAVLDNAKRSSYVDLVLHTGWMTFYNMRAVVSASLLDCTDGGGIQSQIQSATQCLENMAQVSTYALVRLIVDSLDLQPQVNATLRTWMAVKEATRANFPKLRWMDQSTAAGAIHHVDSLITVLTMPEHLKSDEALEKFYVFLDQNVTQPFVVWLYNTYQRRLQEQKRLMKEDPAVPVDREDIVFSPSDDSFAKFLGRLDCVTSLLTNYTSDAVFAKNVLTETFADTAGTEKARLAFGSMELTDGILGYTPEQSFYVASCFLFCSEGAYTWKKTGLYPPMMLRCNLPVHNQERFAEAFSCPVGAALNPQDRCTFHVANEK
ncbi:hypothetical protein HPB52_025026 [Rhipicephalus sanguineus]|uniref:Peptidase M13 C-terminal domain-containing protein n=1 Tax=Rhipicephalus sanguineus TaxID=34632 RepID=A0A9D4TDL4_RHISA|nr:hypothetical protein HPB52_025026 [Rhipicephalus sanguineus]